MPVALRPPPRTLAPLEGLPHASRQLMQAALVGREKREGPAIAARRKEEREAEETTGTPLSALPLGAGRGWECACVSPSLAECAVSKRGRIPTLLCDRLSRSLSRQSEEVTQRNSGEHAALHRRANWDLTRPLLCSRPGKPRVRLSHAPLW